MSRKQRRMPRIPPAPTWSSRLYVRLLPRDVAMLRFLIEAADNLAYVSVLDRRAAVAQVVFSPHQEDEVREMLGGIGERIALRVIEPPGFGGRGQ